jgi:hypothetical protein
LANSQPQKTKKQEQKKRSAHLMQRANKQAAASMPADGHFFAWNVRRLFLAIDSDAKSLRYASRVSV